MKGRRIDGRVAARSPRLVVYNPVLLGVPQDGDREPSLVLRVDLEVILAHELCVERVLAGHVWDSIVLGRDLALGGGVPSVGVADGRVEAVRSDPLIRNEARMFCSSSWYAYLHPFAPMKGCTVETGMKSSPLSLRTIRVR